MKEKLKIEMKEKLKIEMEEFNKKIWEEFWDLKNIELISNGISPTIWIIPLSKNIMKNFKDVGCDFIKEFNDPETKELIKKYEPCLIFKRSGMTYIIKEI